MKKIINLIEKCKEEFDNINDMMGDSAEDIVLQAESPSFGLEITLTPTVDSEVLTNLLDGDEYDYNYVDLNFIEDFDIIETLFDEVECSETFKEWMSNDTIKEYLEYNEMNRKDFKNDLICELEHILECVTDVKTEVELYNQFMQKLEETSFDF